MSFPGKSDFEAFGSLYSHGFVRVAAAVPRVRIADPAFNAERTLALARQASDNQAAVVIFPELGVSGYSIEDLHHQQALNDAVLEAIERIVAESASLWPVIVVGAPLRAERGLFNSAIVIHRGRVLGVVPKSYLPEYLEYYEERQFRATREVIRGEVELLGEAVPFGANLLFASRDLPAFTLHVEICEDLWVPIPPSTYGALAGATVLANLSASNVTVAKADYRRGLCELQSAKLIAGYLLTAAGFGESTTDLAWDGQALIYENGDLLAEAERFSDTEQLLLADLDLDRSWPTAPARTATATRSMTIATCSQRCGALSSTLGSVQRWCRSGARWSAFRTFPQTRCVAASAARRSTASRCGAWRRDSRRPGSRRS
jgi:NAD+ synthase (glutamine-hydrolysing)